MKTGPVRLWIFIIVLLAAITHHMIKINISVSVLGMTVQKNISKCPENSIVFPEDVKIYDWNEHIIGFILSAHGYGFLALSFSAKIIAESQGPYAVLLFSSIISALMNAVIPIFADLHYMLVVGCRVAIGATSALTYSSIQVLLENWLPKNERFELLGALFTTFLSTLMTWPLVSYISTQYNWTYSFYITSAILALFTIIFAFVTADKPTTHRWISLQELQYLKKNVENFDKQRIIIPRYALCTSLRFWAIIIAHFAHFWGVVLWITAAPKFLTNKIECDVNNAIFIASVPAVGKFLFSVCHMYGCKSLWRQKILTIQNIRRFSVIFSHILPGCFILFSLYRDGALWDNITILCVAWIMTGAAICGHLANVQDLTPSSRRIIFEILNFINGLSSLIVPSLTGFFLAQNDLAHQWQTIFLVTSGMYIICGLLYIFLTFIEESSCNTIVEDAGALYNKVT